MGWASLIEDVIKRFDEDNAGSPRFAHRRAGPSKEAAEARAKLDREQLANEIAIREYRENERESEKQQAFIARLKQDLNESNQKLQELKAQLTRTAQANEALGARLAKYRAQYSERVARSASVTQCESPTPVSALVAKIENFKEKDLAALTDENRQRFEALKAYAASERKVKAQEMEIASLAKSLSQADDEIAALRSFCEQIASEGRALGMEVKTYEGWGAMNEWLEANPIISPKELDSTPRPASGKKPEKPSFNPVLRENSR